MRRIPLLWQLLAINTLLIGGTVMAALLIAHPALDTANGRQPFVVLGGGVIAVLLGNLLLLRRRLHPLAHLIDTMERTDLSSQGRRADPRGAESVEVARLHAAFNRMLDRLEAERRSGARAVVRAQEQERQRLAQDLHDEVNQALTAITLRLEASAQDARDPLRRELRETKLLANQAMEELLNLARELRPSALDDHGLVPALRQQVRDFSERTGIHAEFRRRGDVPPLSNDQQLVIYRVTQESLSNVAKHAHAGAVEVELSFVGRTVLRVSDDGRGVNGAARNGGLGVSGMEERAVLVGGSLDVRSKPGQGTTVTLAMS